MAIFKDEDCREQFVKYISERINIAKESRAEKAEKWIKYRHMRKGQSSGEIQESNLLKSSKMAVPLVATISDGIYAQCLSSLMQRDPPWTVENLRLGDSEDNAIADFGTQYFALLAKSKRELNLTSIQKEITYNAVTMGTQFVKVPFNEEFVYFKKEDVNTNVQTAEKMIIRSGPEIVPIDHEDIFYEVNEGLPLNRQPWVAHLITLTKSELKSREDQGYYYNVTEIIDKEITTPPDLSVSERLSDEGLNDPGNNLYKIYEVHAKYDVDEDGLMEEVIVTIHLDTQMILREEFNTFGIRPFEAITYYINPGSVEGIGVCEMAESMQEEASTHHRLRCDAAQLVSLPLYTAVKGCGIKPNEKLFPGKILFTRAPGEIQPLKSGEVYPSSLQAESMAVTYAQKRTGFSDIMAGFADQTLKSRDTFGGQQLRLMEGRGILAAVSEEMRNRWSNIATLVYFQLVANKDKVLEMEKKAQRLSSEDMVLLEKFLNVPIAEIPIRFRFNISTTKLDQTFETKRQNMLALVQLYNQYIQTTIQYSMQLHQLNAMGPNAPAEIKEKIMKGITGLSRLHERVFELFNEDDTQKYIPEYKTMEKILEFRDAYKDTLRLQMEGELNASRTNIGNGQGVVQQSAGDGVGAGQFPGMEAGGEQYATGDSF